MISNSKFLFFALSLFPYGEDSFTKTEKRSGAEGWRR